MTIAARVNESVERAQNGPTLQDLVKQQLPRIRNMLPKLGLTPERLASICIQEARTTPALLECSVDSIVGAVLQAAQVGLEPGPLGHAYLIPRYSKKTRSKECTFFISYKGALELARRSGTLKSIEAREVCETDEFRFRFGLEEELHHVPANGDRGPITHVYGIARFKDGGHYWTVMSRSDIDARGRRSETWGKEWSPWKTDYAAMARKTVIRAMVPFLPLSTEVARTFAADESVVRPGDDGEPLMIEGTVVDANNEQGDQPVGNDRGQRLHVEASNAGMKDNAWHAATVLQVSNGRTSHYGELFEHEVRLLPEHWRICLKDPKEYVADALEEAAADSDAHPVLSAWLGKA